MPRPSALRSILLAFAISRLALLGVGMAAMRALPADPIESAVNYHGHPPTVAPLDIWIRYDAAWYLAIAQRGYAGPIEADYDMRSNFFPLYPALIAALRSTGLDAAVSALIVSNVALLLFLCFLWQWTESYIGAEAATRAVWFYLAFPTGFFLSGIYAESTMLATIVGALYAARRRRWLAAGLAAALALLARPVGALVLPSLLLEWAPSGRRESWTGALKQLACLVIPSIVAAMIYVALATSAFGDALAFTKSQALYRSETMWPWNSFVRLWQEGPALMGYANGMLDAVPAVLAIISLPWVFRRFGAGAGVYAALAVIVPLTSTLVAYSRLVLAAAPCFVLAASWLDTPVRRWLTIGVLSLIQAALFVRFVTWHWVA